MKLSNHDLKTLQQAAISAAVKAGRALKSYSIKDLTIHKKEDATSLAGAVVTEADLKSQGIILDVLIPTLTQFDLALLSEESPDDKRRFEKDYFWCIDPLDGTLPFTEGKDGYAVSIALVSAEGKSILGVVYNPPTNTLWHALRGQGAFKNEAALNVQTMITKKEGPQYFVDRSFLTDPQYDDTKLKLEAFHKGENLTTSLDHIGGAVMQAITLLGYQQGAYFKFPRVGNSGGSIWDYAATHCIYHELNLHATDIFQQPMDLNRLDSTFMNHRGIIFATDEKISKYIHRLYLKMVGG